MHAYEICISLLKLCFEKLIKTKLNSDHNANTNKKVLIK